MARVVCLVADGFGVGALPDASLYGDDGANTLAHVARAVGGLSVPNLGRLGIGHLTPTEGIPATSLPEGIVGRLGERSAGKDTTTGHWELAGLVTRDPFTLFPGGFPASLVDSFVREAGLPGVLGNCAASGTEILERLGEEHLATGKPILYTSGDSVFQIAAHEEKFGLERLYRACETARKLTLPLRIGRVIARPFVGARPGEFRRTEHRRDYALSPARNSLDVLCAAGVDVLGVGKIEDIFDHRGLTRSRHTGNNPDSLLATLDYLRQSRGKPAFVFTNLVDFDMVYGHRRDPTGYARALQELDAFLPSLLGELVPGDLFLLTSDHGCDPTFRGTDHTREYVPLVGYGPGLSAAKIGDRTSFADVAATVAAVLGVSLRELPDVGASVLPARGR